MRLLFLLALLLWSPPAAAWTFSPIPICTLRQEGPSLSVTVTFDPATGLYAIALDRAEGWPTAPVFTIRFEGAEGFTISTNRHQIDGRVLTVTDRGFGNVLRGLAQNSRALAQLGPTEVAFSLEGAAEPVRAFEACPVEGLA